jgi:hypothetical protein
MKKLLLCLGIVGIFLSIFPRAFAAGNLPQLKTRNLILVTLDGLRWQELFSGAEAQLMSKEIGGVSDTNQLRKDFWRDTAEARREALMPFFWKVIAKQGQIFGNVNKGSIVKVSNGHNFSYPGYNEILTGMADPRVNSNSKIPNPNATVLEWLHKKPAFHGRVAAFCAWDVFPYILNRERSGMHVRAGWEPMAVGQLSPRQELLNQLISQSTRVWDSVTYDSFVFQGALDYLNAHKPRLLYVAFGETDDWAHDGRYDRVIQSARTTDAFVQQLWEAVQTMPEYRGTTTLLMTTDHGRGSGLKEWKDHGQKVRGAEFIWVAALGPDTPALGERSNTDQITQSQIAATAAAFLGEDYAIATPTAGKAIKSLFTQ